jgi:hypothetical protein
MRWLVRAAGIYNVSALVAFLTPGVLPALGVAVPASPLWTWLPSLLALFGGIVMVKSSYDLERYASFPYYNGLIRCVFAAVAFAMRFDLRSGKFIGLLALGDLVLGLGCILGLPRALGRTHIQLLTDARVDVRP